MGNRRFAQVSTSEDEDQVPSMQKQQQQQPQPSNTEETQSRQLRRKKMELQEEVEETKTKNKKEKEGKGSESGGEEEEQPQEEAKPIGKPVRFSGKGRGRRSHYTAFEYDGNRYEIEDPVLLVPEDRDQKPYVAIIKDITKAKDGMMVTGQWFYRPEEAEKKGGGNWQSRDTRELFYSFHRDDVPAESVMHKCVVHFVPLHKQLPERKQYPGFIVQKVYDTVEQRLWKLTDNAYEDNKKNEINLLVKKTLSYLVDLPDIETEDPPTAELKAETPGSCITNASEYYTILVKFNALTGENQRDKWLERLLQGIQYVCNSGDNIQRDEKGKRKTESQEKSQKGSKCFIWPDASIPAIVALEKASHDALGTDFQKYNQKLRQLLFNLKNNALLAQRLLDGELEPSKILNMSPSELKEGLTSEEIAKKEPAESEGMQMTDARCSRCMEFKVGLRDIIHGGHEDRYQLECIACGNSWYASRDETSKLTINAPNLAKSVGTAPWATAKFEEVEKKMMNPREPDKAVDDLFRKTSEAFMLVLDSQKSFGKPIKDEHSEATRNAD